MFAVLKGQGFYGLWRPDLMLGLLVLLEVYLRVLRRAEQRDPRGRPLEWRHVGAFGGALLVLYLAEGTPLHALAETYLFSAHMLQHLLLTLVVPPLLLLGLPEWLVTGVLERRAVGIAVGILTRPVVALLMFNLAFSLYHIPYVYQGALLHPALHLLAHGVLMATATISWWPVVTPIRALRLHDGLQILYLFGQLVAQLAVFAMVTYADHLLYPVYARAPRLLGLSPMEDQAVGGFIMSTGGMLAYLPFILLAFSRWAQREPQIFPEVRQIASDGPR